MGDGVEVEVWMHGRQGCLVACVWTAPGTEKGVQMHQMQPDVAPEYRRHRTQSPHYESQDGTSPYLMQDGFSLMSDVSGCKVQSKIPPNMTARRLL